MDKLITLTISLIFSEAHQKVTPDATDHPKFNRHGKGTKTADNMVVLKKERIF